MELGKTGIVYNLNYDHRLANKNYGFRAGVGSNLAQYLFAFTAGGGAYYLTGRGSKHLELGADLAYLVVDEISDDQVSFAFVYPDYSTRTYHASLNFGYRRYGRNTLFRVGIAPGMTKVGFAPGGYISYGITL